jgi:hypothetical protein
MMTPQTSLALMNSSISPKNYPYGNWNLLTSTLDLNLRKKLVQCYIWSMALYGTETWMLRAANQKQLESFEMWCWRRMEKVSWADHVRNKEVRP